MSAPSFTPLEAVALFEGDFTRTVRKDGYEITMDGPMMSPPEAWAPFARHDATGIIYCPDGEPGTPLDVLSIWVRCWD